MKKINIDNLTFSFLIILILIVWTFFAFFTYNQWSKETNASFGTLGDSFGILNSLFSGLAFAGLVYTIYLQKKELKETRDVFIEQSKIYQQQRFDDSFYKQLEIVISIKNELLKRDFGNGIMSHTYFEHVYYQLQKCDSNLSDSELIQSILNSYDGPLSNLGSTYQLYYNTLLIMNEQLIRKGEIFGLELRDYTQIIMAPMDFHELAIFLMYSSTIKEDQHILVKSGLLTEKAIFDFVHPKLERLLTHNFLKN